ncbi:TetR/AcrR family transcriptional regulator [Streptomyces sp. ICN988]|uniref:TetR/AcrR family transcriptional regulator n=1 Tax=Streptomyces sp. ICN988 TaxID=2983765 RepID=UPI00398CC379
MLETMGDRQATIPRHPPRRERILDAALDVIAEHGAIKVTFRRIAEAADVPLGSLTYYFDDMQHLLTDAFTTDREEVAAVVRAVVDRHH